MAGEVSYRVTDDGDHQLVVTEAGHNVALVTVSEARFAQLLENAKNRGDKASRSSKDSTEKGKG